MYIKDVDKESNLVLNTQKHTRLTVTEEITHNNKNKTVPKLSRDIEVYK